jgi:hypothetical protein
MNLCFPKHYNCVKFWCLNEKRDGSSCNIFSSSILLVFLGDSSLLSLLSGWRVLVYLWVDRYLYALSLVQSLDFMV